MKAGTSSGPVALCIFRSRRSLRTPFQCTRIESIVGWSLVPFFGMLDLSSLVYAETNWSFKISTFELLSLWMKPSLFFSGATPVDSCRLLLMYGRLSLPCTSCGLISCPSVFASLSACICSNRQDSWSVLPYGMLCSYALKLAAVEYPPMDEYVWPESS